MTNYSPTLYKQELHQTIDAFPEEHLPDLLELIHYYREKVVLKSAKESFKQAWQEFLNGEVFPIETLWDDFDDE